MTVLSAIWNTLNKKRTLGEMYDNTCPNIDLLKYKLDQFIDPFLIRASTLASLPLITDQLFSVYAYNFYLGLGATLAAACCVKQLMIGKNSSAVASANENKGLYELTTVKPQGWVSTSGYYKQKAKLFFKEWKVGITQPANKDQLYRQLEQEGIELTQRRNRLRYERELLLEHPDVKQMIEELGPGLSNYLKTGFLVALTFAMIYSIKPSLTNIKNRFVQKPTTKQSLQIESLDDQILTGEARTTKFLKSKKQTTKNIQFGNNFDKGDLAKVVNTFSERCNLDPDFIYTILEVESSTNHKGEVSDAGAIGYMQLMPKTAEALGVNPYDPYQNIGGGCRYINNLLIRYNDDLEIALAAYNAGPSRVDNIIKKVKNSGKRPSFKNIKLYLPDETQRFVSKVMDKYQNI